MSEKLLNKGEVRDISRRACLVIFHSSLDDGWPLMQIIFVNDLIQDLPALLFYLR